MTESIPTNGASLQIAEALLAVFRGRADFVARGTAKGFEPAKLPGPMQPAWLARHLGQEQCAGFYLMDEASRVWCSCVDFDNKPESPDPQWREKASSVYFYLQKSGLSPLVEISASGKAAHVWLFCEKPTEAWIIRGFWGVVSEKTGITFREVYPRQDELSGKGMGNLVRYPLWNQSRFVDPENDWEVIGPLQALGQIGRVSGEELMTLAFQLGKPIARRTAPVGNGHKPSELIFSELSARIQERLSHEHSFLARRWGGDMTGLKDQSRSALVFSISCELVRQHVPQREIEAAIRYWCKEHDYEKGQRDQWIMEAVLRAHDFAVQKDEDKSANVMVVRDACDAFITTLQENRKTHVCSGIDELDHSIDGIGWGEMAVVAARPAHGKTALALQWLDHASGTGTRCLLVSEEMSSLEIGKRALLAITWLDQSMWCSEAVPLLRNDVARHYTDKAPIFLVENCNTVDRAEAVIDQFCKREGVQFVAVDYLQLLGSRKNSRYDEVTEISRRLKQTSQRNSCALMALCQLNRQVDSRPSHVPELCDLRDSGQLEQDADLVLFLQWPHKYDQQMPENEYYIYAAKRRNGPIRSPKVVTLFYPSRQRIGQFPSRAPDACNHRQDCQARG